MNGLCYHKAMTGARSAISFTKKAARMAADKRGYRAALLRLCSSVSHYRKGEHVPINITLRPYNVYIAS